MNSAISPRHADHPVDAQFVDRWSPRAFASTPMTEGQMLTLLEAARWAPSSSNLQPWRFVWALRGTAEFDVIAATLVPGNHVWAHKAAGLVVVASKTTALRGEASVPNGAHAFDAGAAWAMLALQAHLKGMSAHAMGGFDRDALGVAVALPADHVLHALVAVGHPGDPTTLPEALRARETPNGRVPLTDLARRASF